jgi:transcriptional regulator with XRE-family HTH domain
MLNKSNLVGHIKPMERFGEKLQVLRQRHKMSQRQLSDLLDVHHSYVGALELGKKKPSVAMLLKISRIFNVSLDQLAKDELELD